MPDVPHFLRTPGLGAQSQCHPDYPPYALRGIFVTMYTSKIFCLLERDLILLTHSDTLRRTFPQFSPLAITFFLQV